jgi:hypothetical protein
MLFSAHILGLRGTLRAWKKGECPVFPFGPIHFFDSDPAKRACDVRCSSLGGRGNS